MSDQDFDDACALERLARDTDIALEACLLYTSRCV